MSVDLVRTTLLEEANDLIHGERAEAYGSALENATAWAEMMRAATGLDVKPEHYPVSQICCKLVRERHKTKRDNWRDVAGYAGVWGKMEEERKMELQPPFEREKVIPERGIVPDDGYKEDVAKAKEEWYEK